MFATHPEMAKEWAAHTPDMAKLPEKVKPRKPRTKKKAEALDLTITPEHFNQALDSVTRTKEAGLLDLARPLAKPFMAGVRSLRGGAPLADDVAKPLAQAARPLATVTDDAVKAAPKPTPISLGSAKPAPTPAAPTSPIRPTGPTGGGPIAAPRPAPKPAPAPKPRVTASEATNTGGVVKSVPIFSEGNQLALPTMVTRRSAREIAERTGTPTGAVWMNRFFKDYAPSLGMQAVADGSAYAVRAGLHRLGLQRTGNLAYNALSGTGTLLSTLPKYGLGLKAPGTMLSHIFTPAARANSVAGGAVGAMGGIARGLPMAVAAGGPVVADRYLGTNVQGRVDKLLGSPVYGRTQFSTDGVGIHEPAKIVQPGWDLFKSDVKSRVIEPIRQAVQGDPYPLQNATNELGVIGIGGAEAIKDIIHTQAAAKSRSPQAFTHNFRTVEFNNFTLEEVKRQQEELAKAKAILADPKAGPDAWEAADARRQQHENWLAGRSGNTRLAETNRRNAAAQLAMIGIFEATRAATRPEPLQQALQDYRDAHRFGPKPEPKQLKTIRMPSLAPYQGLMNAIPYLAHTPGAARELAPQVGAMAASQALDSATPYAPQALDSLDQTLDRVESHLEKPVEDAAALRQKILQLQQQLEQLQKQRQGAPMEKQSLFNGSPITPITPSITHSPVVSPILPQAPKPLTPPRTLSPQAKNFVDIAAQRTKALQQGKAPPPFPAPTPTPTPAPAITKQSALGNAGLGLLAGMANPMTRGRRQNKLPVQGNPANYLHTAGKESLFGIQQNSGQNQSVHPNTNVSDSTQKVSLPANSYKAAEDLLLDSPVAQGISSLEDLVQSLAILSKQAALPPVVKDVASKYGKQYVVDPLRSLFGSAAKEAPQVAKTAPIITKMAPKVIPSVANPATATKLAPEALGAARGAGKPPLAAHAPAPAPTAPPVAKLAPEAPAVAKAPIPAPTPAAAPAPKRSIADRVWDVTTRAVGDAGRDATRGGMIATKPMARMIEEAAAQGQTLTRGQIINQRIFRDWLPSLGVQAGADLAGYGARTLGSRVGLPRVGEYAANALTGAGTIASIVPKYLMGLKSMGTGVIPSLVNPALSKGTPISRRIATSAAGALGSGAIAYGASGGLNQTDRYLPKPVAQGVRDTIDVIPGLKGGTTQDKQVIHKADGTTGWSDSPAERFGADVRHYMANPAIMGTAALSNFDPEGVYQAVKPLYNDTLEKAEKIPAGVTNHQANMEVGHAGPVFNNLSQEYRRLNDNQAILQNLMSDPKTTPEQIRQIQGEIDSAKSNLQLGIQETGRLTNIQPEHLEKLGIIKERYKDVPPAELQARTQILSQDMLNAVNTNPNLQAEIQDFYNLAQGPQGATEEAKAYALARLSPQAQQFIQKQTELSDIAAKQVTDLAQQMAQPAPVNPQQANPQQLQGPTPGEAIQQLAQTVGQPINSPADMALPQNQKLGDLIAAEQKKNGTYSGLGGVFQYLKDMPFIQKALLLAGLSFGVASMLSGAPLMGGLAVLGTLAGAGFAGVFDPLFKDVPKPDKSAPSGSGVDNPSVPVGGKAHIPQDVQQAFAQANAPAFANIAATSAVNPAQGLATMFNDNATPAPAPGAVAPGQSPAPPAQSPPQQQNAAMTAPAAPRPLVAEARSLGIPMPANPQAPTPQETAMMTNWAKSKPTQAELINAFANMSPANRAEVKNGLNAAIDNNSKVKLMGRRAARMDPAGNQALRVIEALDAIERYQARQ